MANKITSAPASPEGIPTQKVLVGFFHVEGQTETIIVETPIPGKTPKEQYAELDRLVALRFPRVRFQRTGSLVENRCVNDLGYIDTTEGQTLRRLFPDVPTDARQDTIQVGTVFYEGEPCTLWIQYNRERNAVSPILKPRLAGRPIRPGLSFSGGHLVSELESLLTRGLGSQARNLVLKIK